MKKGATLRGEIDRIQKVPKQYQRGWTEFYKLKFFLTPDVLIPRPETELLVDEVITFSEKLSSSRMRGSGLDSPLPAGRHGFQGNDKLTIVDIGTGSGCIAISIAKNLKNARVFALEVSPEALKVAVKNATFHNVEKRILFMESDLLAALTLPNKTVISSPSTTTQDEKSADSGKDKSGDLSTASRDDNRKSGQIQPDIIVANLPYIPSPRIMLIDPMVRDFEPKVALDGGIDGFELYRKLFTQMQLNNFYPKVLISEIDEEQGEAALSETKRFFPKAKIEVKKDFYGSDRILKITF
jgi:release factor glutamine methyltransferase